MKVAHYLIFIVLLLSISIYYNFPHYLQQPPKGKHVWRQTDCASIALNYYERDMNFFQPQLHNQLSNNGKTVAELPIIYYTAAIFYSLFSPDEMYFRFINLTIFFLGLLALFHLTYYLSGSSFWAYIPPLFLFCCPILLFYGTNFLPNVPALSFIFVGWAFLYHYSLHAKKRHLLLAGLAFTLAGLLKATAMISVVALLILFSLSLIQKKIPIQQRQLFSYKARLILWFAVIILVLVGWYSFANYYKEVNKETYFLTQTNPIWSLNGNKIIDIYKLQVDFWSQFYASSATLIVGMFMTVAGFFYYVLRFKQVGFWAHLTFLTFFGALSIIILWYENLFHHPYYVIGCFIFPALLFVNVIKWGLETYPQVFKSYYVKGAVILFLLHNIHYGQAHFKDMYEEFDQENPHQAFYHPELDTFLQQNGVDKNDQIISLPDKSPNRTLYFLNRPGYTFLYHKHSVEATIRNYKERGAEYLLISDTSLISKPSYKPFTEDTVGEFHGLYLFKL